MLIETTKEKAQKLEAIRFLSDWTGISIEEIFQRDLLIYSSAGIERIGENQYLVCAAISPEDLPEEVVEGMRTAGGLRGDGRLWLGQKAGRISVYPRSLEDDDKVTAIGVQNEHVMATIEHGNQYWTPFGLRRIHLQNLRHPIVGKRAVDEFVAKLYKW